MAKYTIKRTGRTWSIYDQSGLVEGGFFSRAAADEALEKWLDADNDANYREDFHSDGF